MADRNLHNENPAVKDQRYESLYTELLDRGDQLHEANKRRIKRGLITLLILPVVLDFIRLVTDSDKVVFLIIWILIMFAMSAFLISVEYLDSAIEKTLVDVTDTEADFDGLLPRPDGAVSDLHERIRKRLEEIRAERLGAEDTAVDEEAEYIEEVIEHLEETMDEVTAIAADAIALNHMDELETKYGYIDADPEDNADQEDNMEEVPEVEEPVADIPEVEEPADDLQEAENAIEELRETAPSEIITAMKEAFDRDMSRNSSTVELTDESAGEEDAQ